MIARSPLMCISLKRYLLQLGIINQDTLLIKLKKFYLPSSLIRTNFLVIHNLVIHAKSKKVTNCPFMTLPLFLILLQILYFLMFGPHPFPPMIISNIKLFLLTILLNTYGCIQLNITLIHQKFLFVSNHWWKNTLINPSNNYLVIMVENTPNFNLICPLVVLLTSPLPHTHLNIMGMPNDIIATLLKLGFLFFLMPKCHSNIGHLPSSRLYISSIICLPLHYIISLFINFSLMLFLIIPKYVTSDVYVILSYVHMPHINCLLSLDLVSLQAIHLLKVHTIVQTL